MLQNSAKTAQVVLLLMPKAATNTGDATSLGVLVSKYEGDLMITQCVGVVTAGTIVGKMQACSDAAGTGAADIAGATFTSVGTSTDESVQKITLDSNTMPAAKPYLRYIGTVGTGPADVCVVMHSRPKYPETGAQ